MIAVIKIGIFLLNLFYSFVKLIPTKSKITMISRQSNTPSLEFLAVKEAAKAKHPNVKVVMLCRTLDNGVESTVADKIKYAFHMVTQMVHIASSSVVLLDSYCITVSILKHKKSLTVIQMWHSMGSMKKFGYTALDTGEGSQRELALAMKMHNNYDCVFASSDAYKEHLAKGMNVDIEKLVTMPLPRLDFLRNEEYAANTKMAILEKYPVLGEKKNVLYCPTFRKDERDFEAYLENLVNAINKEKYNLIVKLHPLSKVKLKGDTVTAEEFSSFQMLFAADYVISDYSCIVYEAAVRKIPLFFYNPDMSLYTESRGLAIDYEKELPGVISGDAKVIAKALDGAYDMESLKKFTQKYICCNGSATENIVKFIEQFLN